MKTASLKLLPVGYPVYRAISQLNRSFEECNERFDHMLSFKLFPTEHLRAYQAMIQEARALANQDFAEVIDGRELENSAYYEHLRLKLQGQFPAERNVILRGRTTKQLPKKKGRNTRKERKAVRR